MLTEVEEGPGCDLGDANGKEERQRAGQKERDGGKAPNTGLSSLNFPKACKFQH